MESGKRPTIIVGLIAFFALITIVTVAMFFMPWRSEVASEEGKGIDAVITYLLWATGALVVLGHIILIRFLWKGRGEPGYQKPAARVEWMWGIIPVVVMMLLSEAGVLVIGSPAWKKLYIDRPTDALEVEVVGKQFEWIVRYPGKDGEFGPYDFKWVSGADNRLGLDEDADASQDDIITSELYLPLGRPVHIRLRTHDVIHSFFVPEFRVKQDLLPGFPTETWFTPTRTGKFELACTELCGLGHYTMNTFVHVLEPEEFDRWLASKPGFGE
ncbi:MAG: cytochrome c oxidase subunit II [Planctomycetota bacterium]|jgi:cytochrome c oxidase subunit 2